jgi:hypothetical protein
MKPGVYTAKVTAKNRSGKSAAWKLASVTARFFSGKFIVEVDYELEGGVVKSASGRVWKK